MLDEIVIKDINTGDVVESLLGFLLYVEKSNTHKNLLFHKLGIYSSEILTHPLREFRELIHRAVKY